jgi:radical SAM superfamily enzyme YgiQ (UPF0313 family)
MIRVFLLNPPFLAKFSREQRSPAVTKSGTLYYPYWLAYATAYLRKHDFPVFLLDATPQNLAMAEVIGAIREFKPNLLIMSSSTPSFHHDILVAGEIKASFPELFLVFVGSHVSALAGDCLQQAPQIDAICRREYDQTVREIAERLETTPDLSGILGVSHRLGDQIVHEPDRPYLEQLDDIPAVTPIYKEFLHIPDYFYAITRHPVVALMTGRGCPFRCTYCVYPQTLHGRKFRAMSPERIVSEFRFIQEHLPEVKEVFIEDDTFTVNKPRCRRFCELLIEQDIRLPWTANSRADLDLDTLKLMKKAGLRLLCVGVESGNQQILDNIRKGIRLETIRQFFQDAKKAGVLIHGCFMVGNQGETRTTLAETLAFAKELQPDTVQFFPLMVYPGTEAYTWACDNNLLETNDFRHWLTETGLHNTVISTPEISARELLAFCDQARQDFYLRPAYILYKLQQVIRHPSETKRLLKSFRTFARYLLQRPASRN